LHQETRDENPDNRKPLWGAKCGVEDGIKVKLKRYCVGNGCG